MCPRFLRSDVSRGMRDLRPLAGKRKAFKGRALLPFVLIGLFLSCALTFHKTDSSIALVSFVSLSLQPQSSKTQLAAVQLESPILQPIRTIQDHVPDEHDGPLNQHLRRIRDVPNWRVLGGIESTGEQIYEDKETHRLLTNEANIAFFVQIAESNIILAPRLLSRIWHPDNIYCIHFDTKIPFQQTDMFVRAIKSNPKLSNVFILPSVPVTYAGVSMLLNTLESIDALLRVSQHWDYFINISGSDYPLVSVTAMRRLLGRRDVRDASISFIHFAYAKEKWPDAVDQRFGSLHFDLALGFNENSAGDLHKPSAPRHPILESKNLRIEIAKGAAWIIGHRSFCEYAAHGSAGRRLITLFANMQHTPEHFFQTLAWNHKELNQTTARHSLRQIVFKAHENAGPHPLFLDRRSSNGSWDMWHVLEHSPHFFARKFRVPDSKLLDHIDSQKSGATEKQANMTAVSRSFALVRNRFSCVINVRAPIARQRMEPCLHMGWREQGCKDKQEELCVGDFAEPPV